MTKISKEHITHSKGIQNDINIDKKKSTRYKILTNQRAALKFKPILFDVLCTVIGYIHEIQVNANDQLLMRKHIPLPVLSKDN